MTENWPNTPDMIDISPLISERTAVFPGDTTYSRSIAMDMQKGDHLGLSAITTTLHIGAHVDAPNHYSKNGEGIATRELEYYYGPCQVEEILTATDKRITLEDWNKRKILAPRVLLKTCSFVNPDDWHNNFHAFSPELIEFLAAGGVKLIGIDTPSIDPATDKKLLSHQSVAKHNLAILEGVVLNSVTPGLYTLMALPLKLEAADASPVRAVLIKGKNESS